MILVGMLTAGQVAIVQDVRGLTAHRGGEEGPNARSDAEGFAWDGFSDIEGDVWSFKGRPKVFKDEDFPEAYECFKKTTEMFPPLVREIRK